MEILVFKTNVRHKKQVNQIVPHLQKLYGIHQWNVDLHDKDKVLRIEAYDLSPQLVELTLRDAGYYCEELQ